MNLTDALAPFAKKAPDENGPWYGGYSDGFLRCMEFVLPHEVEFQSGHYGDYDFVRTEHDPNDPGGTTRYGLDAASHPHLDIESLTLAQALLSYHGDIWTPLRCDEMDAEVALCLCDAAINCGTVRAVKWLQGVVGADVDGNLGPNTLAAINADLPHDVAVNLNARRMDYYQDEVRPSLRAIYLPGWTNRMDDLTAALA